MNRITADFLLLFAAAVWGLAFYFQKSAMTDIGPFLFIAARASVAALALAPLAFMEMRHRANGGGPGAIDRNALVRLALMGGTFFFLGAAFQQAGLITATITNAGFLTGLY